jgi:2-oxoglutarate dehydrogenase E2 component (dihydrolipoamide succinyltransferase)
VTAAATLLDVPMPHMGVSVEEAVVVAWHVDVSDTVEVDQPICDVSTDKVDTEIASPVTGTVVEILIAEGETVAVGAALLRVSGDGVDGALPGATRRDPTHADRSVSPDSETDTSRAAASDRRHASDLLAGSGIDAAGAVTAVLARPNRKRRVLASPVARRLAAERGVDLTSVTGTGRGGRIAKRDVEAATAAAAAVSRSADAPRPAEAAGSADAPRSRIASLELPRGYEDVPYEAVELTHVRRAIAEHMVRSRQTAAHMTTECEVDMHSASLVRSELNVERERAGQSRITPLACITRAAIDALRDFPDLNGTFQEQRMLRWREINLGVAVDAPGGLVVPIIRRAEQLTVGALADAIADLGARARNRGLKPEDVRGGTFTISNPGAIGAVSAPAIINQPQVAILGVAAIVKRPWVVATADGSDAIVPRPIMRLALTFDHRAVDGGEATRYIVRVKHLLETWDAAAYR